MSDVVDASRVKQARRPTMSVETALGSVKAHLGEQAASHVAVSTFVNSFANVAPLDAVDPSSLTALNAVAIEALLTTTGFEPRDDIRVAVDVVLSKARRPSNTGDRKNRKNWKEMGPPDRIAVAELTWLLTQDSKRVESGETGAGSKKRRSEHGEADFGTMVRASPLLAKIRRELRDTTNVTDTVVRTPLSDSDFTSLVETLCRPLPMSFRVHRGDACLYAAAKSILDGWRSMPPFDQLRPSPVFANCAWAGTCPPLTLGHEAYHLPENVDVELGCRNGHSAGMWSFQEVVSMLPVAALGIQPHHRVLDMCAAPGSKTLQALDAIVARGQEAATGIIIANEIDRVKSRQTLPSRLKRHHSANAVVTRSDATMFPTIVLNRDHSVAKFDRIVCDVPCSGDGTARKDTSVWTGWSDEYAASLNKTQRSILLRAVDLLALDGIVAYSTCSMNPQEDEEVVARCIDCYGDEVELLDVNEVLRDAGVVLHSSGGVDVPPAAAARSQAEPEGAAAQRLEAQKEIARKVLRVLPQRDDTGGFFVALIRRVKPHATDAPPLTKMNNWTNAKRFSPIDAASPYVEGWRNALDGFGLPDTPCGLHPVAMVTPNGDAKKILLASQQIVDIVLHSQLRKGPGVEVVSVGMRAFERLDPRYLPDSALRYRLSGEAAHLLGPLATRRVVRVDDPKDVKEIFQKGYLHESTPAELRRSDGSPDVGPVVLRIRLDEGDVFWAAGVLTHSKLDLTVDANIRRVMLKYRLRCSDVDITNGLQDDALDDNDRAEED